MSSHYLARRVLRRAVVSLVLCCAGTACAADEEQLILEPALREQLAVMLKNYQPKAPIAALGTLHEIENKGNFGKIVSGNRIVRYAPVQEGGLLPVFSSMTMTGSGGSAQALSICGLITALSLGSSATVSASTTALPVGNMFVPFGVRSTTDINRKQKLLRLETSADLCAPTPGSEFSYRTETEHHFKIGGLLGRTVSGVRTEQIVCKSAAETQPASSLHADLRGVALPVSCEMSTQGGDKSKTDYLFLPDAGLYVQVGEFVSAQTTRIQVKEVSYATPSTK
jgi:hypothetical protein